MFMENEIFLLVGDCPPYRKIPIINDLAISKASGTARLGLAAGSRLQSDYAVAVGYGAGANAQGWSAIAIGWNAGLNNQSKDCVAVGHRAGQEDQQLDAIAIGVGAGEFNQGEYAVAVGKRAGRHNQAPKTIVINASGQELENRNPGTTVIKPMRVIKQVEPGFVPAYYNPDTGELVYFDPT